MRLIITNYSAMLFYMFSVAAALYALYLLRFRTFHKNREGEPTNKRVMFPHIAYIALAVTSFIPFLNLLFIVCFLTFFTIFEDEYYIKSWLFKKTRVNL